MKLWIDDVRPAPNKEYFWVQSVNEAKDMIKYYIDNWDNAILIDLDHDAGAEVTDGGDYIKLLDWLEANNIVNERQKQKFLSIEDLQNRCKISATLIDKMKSMKILDGMDESSQLSLF